MGSKADRKRRRRARASAPPGVPGVAAPRAANDAKPRLVGQSRPLARRENGLDMLLGKRRLTREQARMGRDYGVLERTAAIEGEASIRSNLAEPTGSAGAVGLAEVTGAEWIVDCRRKLALAQAALNWHGELIAVLNLICGRGMHPRDITSDQRESEQIETSLRLGLDMLIAWEKAAWRAAREKAG